MKIKSFYEYQSLLKSMLYFIDKFCRDNNIEYTVCCGTMLGTVRHHDIIPWDGDIDIAMTRTNLEKLINCFKTYNGRFYLCYLPENSIKKINKQGYDVTHARLLDKKSNNPLFCIDIYTIDFLGDDLEHAKKAVELYPKYYKYAGASISYHRPPLHSYNSAIQNMRNRVVRTLHPLFWLASLITKPVYNILYRNYQKKYLSFDSNSRYCTLIPYYLKRMGVADNFYHKTINMKFGNFQVMILDEYDAILRKSYGDYMQLPPVEKRQPYPSERELTCIEVELDDELNHYLNLV